MFADAREEDSECHVFLLGSPTMPPFFWEASSANLHWAVLFTFNPGNGPYSIYELAVTNKKTSAFCHEIEVYKLDEFMKENDFRVTNFTHKVMTSPSKMFRVAQNLKVNGRDYDLGVLSGEDCTCQTWADAFLEETCGITSELAKTSDRLVKELGWNALSFTGAAGGWILTGSGVGVGGGFYLYGATIAYGASTLTSAAAAGSEGLFAYLFANLAGYGGFVFGLLGVGICAGVGALVGAGLFLTVRPVVNAFTADQVRFRPCRLQTLQDASALLGTLREPRTEVMEDRLVTTETPIKCGYALAPGKYVLTVTRQNSFISGWTTCDITLKSFEQTDAAEKIIARNRRSDERWEEELIVTTVSLLELELTHRVTVWSRAEGTVRICVRPA